MSKGLEALEKIENNLIAIHSKLPHSQCPDLTRFVRRTYDFDLIEKELKALKIIKPYINDLIGRNVYDKDLAEYFIETIHGRKYINKENYDLLKEVLNA